MKKNVFIAIIIIVSFLFSIIATIISIQNYGSNIISKKMKDGYVPVNSKVVKVIRSIKEYINGITHLNQIIAEINI